MPTIFLVHTGSAAEFLIDPMLTCIGDIDVRYGVGANEAPIANDYWEFNGHVNDDVAWPWMVKIKNGDKTFAAVDI